MSNQCGGFYPQIRKTGKQGREEPEVVPAQGSHLEINRGAAPFEYMDPAPGNTGTTAAPQTSQGQLQFQTPQTAQSQGQTQAPIAAQTQTSDGNASMPNLLNPVVPDEAPGQSSAISLPEVIPNAPFFQVPANPLLPPGYQEILSYNNVQYLNGFLRTQIGKNCQVEFLIGTNEMVTREGRLVAVGLNFILLQDPRTLDITTCDFYSIKFVTFDA